MIIWFRRRDEDDVPDDISENKQSSVFKDFPFMRSVGKVLKDRPKTWAAYPDTIEGARQILAMEKEEHANAVSTAQECKELVHVAAATLNLWRKLSHVES